MSEMAKIVSEYEPSKIKLFENDKNSEYEPSKQKLLF